AGRTRRSALSCAALWHPNWHAKRHLEYRAEFDTEHASKSDTEHNAEHQSDRNAKQHVIQQYDRNRAAALGSISGSWGDRDGGWSRWIVVRRWRRRRCGGLGRRARFIIQQYARL